MSTQSSVSMDTLVSLCKRRGIVFPNSEIYGGFGSTWDYGPLGVELKNNIKRAWWRDMVWARPDVVGLDGAILSAPDVWQVSGHVEHFTDALVECRSCHRRFKADELGTNCPHCGASDFTDTRQFNTMFKTFVGPVEDDASVAYLRPETCQMIYLNFRNVQLAARMKLPFGIAQIGKAFRNEITPGNFIFRTREFEQMELEYFVKPDTAAEWFDRWVEERLAWYVRYGIPPDLLERYEVPDDERAHYSLRTVDIKFRYPFGLEELEGIANRGDYDLRQHAAASGKELDYFDDQSQEHLIPHIVEPSVGVERPLLAFLVAAYAEEVDARGNKRVVLRLHPQLAPVKAAVFPLVRRDAGLVALAQEIYATLGPEFPTIYDESAAVGRRYRRQDEIGTPWCITVDRQSLEDRTVTVRERDSMTQERQPVDELLPELQRRLREPWAPPER